MERKLSVITYNVCVLLCSGWRSLYWCRPRPIRSRDVVDTRRAWWPDHWNIYQGFESLYSIDM